MQSHQLHMVYSDICVMSALSYPLQALGDELRMLVVRHRLSEELTSLMDGYVTLLQRISKTRRPGKKTPVEIELASWQLQRASWVPQVSVRCTFAVMRTFSVILLGCASCDETLLRWPISVSVKLPLERCSSAMLR